jgi:tRNA threonylcarbamoyladenosine biosynthesis protein TsaB
MNVLGFDTSTHATAVALRLGDATTLRERDDPPASEHPGHATRLLALAAALLARAELRWQDVERVAVGVGPGRFTGLRVGAATARGLAHSLAVGLAGVSSLRALALPALGRREGPPRVLAVIDALRGEVFAAGFEAQTAEPVHTVRLAGALAPDELAERLEHASVVDEGWLAVGDGAVRYRAQLAAAGAVVPSDDSPLHLVDAGAICALGADADAAVGRLEELLPDYRRRPDAELRPRSAAPTALAGPAEDAR